MDGDSGYRLNTALLFWVVCVVVGSLIGYAGPLVLGHSGGSQVADSQPCSGVYNYTYVDARFERDTIAVQRGGTTNLSLFIGISGETTRFDDPVKMGLFRPVDSPTYEPIVSNPNVSISPEVDREIEMNITAPNKTGVYSLTAPNISHDCKLEGDPARAIIEVYDPKESGFELIELAIRNHFQNEGLDPIAGYYVRPVNGSHAHVSVEAQRLAENDHYNVTIRRNGKLWSVIDLTEENGDRTTRPKDI